jgi:Ni/Fe-hydrogenase subunit HybB-like protein
MKDEVRPIKDVLWILALLGLVAGVFRLWFGLGATTNLSDAMPWGLWKILNMVAGVALSTSGFTVGFLVYVVGIRRLQRLMRPAILIAFLGYGCSMFALLFDIGLPHRFWHPVIMWNEHSFLFEVFWCVLLYFTVTFVEMLPLIFERFGVQRVVRVLRGMAFVIVVVGISLSSLHHSSLGSLFLVTPIRLHPLWYSSWLPLFFILSAMGAGLMLLVLVRILYARRYDPEPVFGPAREAGGGRFSEQTSPVLEEGMPTGREMPGLSMAASVGAGVLTVYLILKVIDLFRRAGWPVLLAGTWESWLFGCELLIGIVLPVILVVVPRTRRSPIGLGIAAFAAAFGLALNRLDVGIFGYFRDASTVYFPSLTEWALSIGVIAAAGLVFFFIVEHFPIFEERARRRGPAIGIFREAVERWSRVWYPMLLSGLHRVTLIAVFTIPAGWVLLYPPYHKRDRPPGHIYTVIGVGPARDTLRIDGNRAGVATMFPHADHRHRLGGDSSCTTCHHVSLPGDRSTACSQCHRHMVVPTVIFDHVAHMAAVANEEELGGWRPANRSCTECHDREQPKTARNVQSCYECHQEDMWLGGEPDSTMDLLSAPPFQAAMHGTCVECHRRERENVSRPDLDECSTCHSTLRAREWTEYATDAPAPEPPEGVRSAGELYIDHSNAWWLVALWRVSVSQFGFRGRIVENEGRDDPLPPTEGEPGLRSRE